MFGTPRGIRTPNAQVLNLPTLPLVYRSIEIGAATRTRTGERWVATIAYTLLRRIVWRESLDSNQNLTGSQPVALPVKLLAH